jgi:chromosome segregation ATPase
MLAQVVQTVEGGLYRLGRKIWKDDPLIELREQADRLSDELRRRYAALERLRAEREEVAQRLADHEINAAMLVSRIETYVHIGDSAGAWRHALELDQVRREMKRDRARLGQCEERCRRQRAHVRQVEGELADLLDQLYPR